MAASTTFLDIQNRVLDEISKSDSTTRNRVKNSINRGYKNFVSRELWPFREVTGTLNTIAGTQEYTLISQFTDIDTNNILSVALQGAVQKKLAYIPFAQLRIKRPDFDYDAASVPTNYYIRAGKIGFYPSPADVYAAAVDYYSLATELSNDSDEPIIPVAYRDALIEYALSKEHDFNTDPDLAQKAMNEYEQIVTLARNNLLVQPNDMNSFRILGPADFRNHTGLSQEIR